MTTYRSVFAQVESELDAAGVWCGHGYADTHDEAIALVLAASRLPADTGIEILDQSYPQAAASVLQRYVDARTRERQPVAYITGEAFLGPCRFRADNRALVPRSPLAEVVQYGFQPWWCADDSPGCIVDVCCGGGSLGLLAAWAFPEAEIVLMDLDRQALSLAAENVSLQGAVARTMMLQADLLAPLAPDSVDIILANPPYVDAPEMASLAPEYQHEPRHALAAGEDGLALVPQLFAGAARSLKPEGVLFLEVGNSWHAMEETYPMFPFVWLDLENGGEGITVLTQPELCQLVQQSP